MEELSKLEKIILEKIRSVGPNGMPGAYVDAIMPEVRKKIEQAFDAGGNYQLGSIEESERGIKNEYPNKDQWIKENL